MKQVRIILLIFSILFALYILFICLDVIQKVGTKSDEIVKEKLELNY